MRGRGVLRIFEQAAMLGQAQGAEHLAAGLECMRQPHERVAVACLEHCVHLVYHHLGIIEVGRCQVVRNGFVRSQ